MMCILGVYEIGAQGLGAVTVFDSEKKGQLNLFLETIMFKFHKVHFNPLKKTDSRKIAHIENCPHGNLPTLKIAHMEICPH